MDTIEIYIRVNIIEYYAENIKSKYIIVNGPITGYYVTEIGFAAYLLGQTKHGFTQTIRHKSIFVAHLYWDPDIFQNKAVVNTASKRLFIFLKNRFYNNSNWNSYINSHIENKWKIHEYWTLD